MCEIAVEDGESRREEKKGETYESGASDDLLDSESTGQRTSCHRRYRDQPEDPHHVDAHDAAAHFVRSMALHECDRECHIREERRTDGAEGERAQPGHRGEGSCDQKN